MSEPEIARRCASCGASIRERAFFCPQCGLSLGAEHPATGAVTYATQPLVEHTSSVEQAKAQTPSGNGQKVAPVEKERRISSVVLDEAAYDPSLRFVLVAAALFLLFIIIVIISRVIG